MATPPGGFAGDGGAPPEGGDGDAGGDPFASPAFTPRERAILAYTDRVTVAPATVTAADLRPLRDAGLDDRAIHDACAIIAYFAFVNRMADGLGVELEDEHREREEGVEW